MPRRGCSVKGLVGNVRAMDGARSLQGCIHGDPDKTFHAAVTLTQPYPGFLTENVRPAPPAAQGGPCIVHTRI